MQDVIIFLYKLLHFCLKFTVQSIESYAKLQYFRFKTILKDEEWCFKIVAWNFFYDHLLLRYDYSKFVLIYKSVKKYTVKREFLKYLKFHVATLVTDRQEDLIYRNNITFILQV